MHTPPFVLRFKSNHWSHSHANTKNVECHLRVTTRLKKTLIDCAH